MHPDKEAKLDTVIRRLYFLGAPKAGVFLGSWLKLGPNL